jgi:SAM-dependent methyltransferase
MTMVDIASIAPGLELREDGIWYSPDAQAVSYPAEGHGACIALEDESFWFRHRNRCIVAAVKAFPPADGGTIFDIGGGNGFVARGLLDAGFDTVLLEPGAAGARNAQRRGVRQIICATTETARLRDGSLPAVGLFDVIEHIEDDAAFLRSLRSKLHGGGRLYATVPAFQTLWSEDDVGAGHFRRYTRAAITGTIAAAGFEIEIATYIFRPLPLPIFLSRVLPDRLGIGIKREVKKDEREHQVSGGTVARLLGRVLASEVRNIRARRPMRFGGSCLVVARAV